MISSLTNQYSVCWIFVLITFYHSETDEENWETQQDQFNEEAAGEENADEENNLLTGINCRGCENLKIL